MKVIIAGSRSFNNFRLLCKKVDLLLSNQQHISIICGMAKGADLLGYQYAKMNKYPIIEMPADWNKYGKSAGYKRNVEMAKIADAVIVFWDGKSKGSKHMIDIAKEHNLPLRIINF